MQSCLVSRLDGSPFACVSRLPRTKSVVAPKNHSLRVAIKRTLAEKWRPGTLVCRTSDRGTNAVLTYVSNLAQDQFDG